MEVVTHQDRKPQKSYKHASISCILYRGPQMLKTSGLLVYFEFLVKNVEKVDFW